MSESDGGPGRREVAYRLFAAEYDDADRSYKESDEERAPNYVVTPTGARANRLFAVGVLTEVEQVNESMVRGRVVDPTGAFVCYAGQYQPDALAFLERAEPPAFVAMTGKARTFEPDDGDRVYTSVRPESLTEVDAETRDRWVVGTAERTLERVATAAGAIETGLAGDELRAALEAVGVEPGLAAGIPLALSHYGTTPTYLDAVRETAVDAARVVAGERDEVADRRVATDATGDVTAASLADPEVAAATVPPGADVAAGDATDTADPEPTADGTEAGGDATSTDVGGDAAGADAGGPADGEGLDEAGGGDEGDGTAVAETASGADDGATAEPEEFELDEETRREVEEEHGVEFSTGSEVDEPGETDLETPGAEEAVGDGPDDAGAGGADESETADTPEDYTDESGGSMAAEPDLQAAVLEAMAELDDGDGADHGAVVEAVDADAGAVEDAIEDALKSGRCYEPEDGRLKPI